MGKYINASILEAWCDAGIQAMEEVLGNKPMVNLWDVLNELESIQDWRVDKMKDDTPCVVFCSPTTATGLMNTDDSITGSLVVTSILDDNTIYVVECDEFLRWLEGKE